MTSEPNGSARWQFGINTVMMVFSLAVPVVAFLVQTASLETKLEGARAQVVALDRRILALEGAVQINREDIAAQKAAFVEIETQFHAADEMRNLTHAQDMRDYAIVYRKVFGADYPMGPAYFPTIARPEARSLAK